MSVEIGKPAPAFTLPDADGRDVSLADLEGQHVILYFYPRDDTPGCTKEACAFRDLSRKLARHGAAVVGVSPDDPDSHRKFAKKYKLPFTLLCDPGKNVMKLYGAFGEKALYGKRVTGVIRSTVWIGPDGTVLKHWKKVSKAADHPAQVLAALEAAEAEA